MDSLEALFNQPPRDVPTLEALAERAQELWNLVDDDGTEYDHSQMFSACLIAAATHIQMEQDVRYRDTFDEQLAGVVRALVASIDNINPDGVSL